MLVNKITKTQLCELRTSLLRPLQVSVVCKSITSYIHTWAATTKRPPARPMKPQSLQGKKPPKFALDGNKWAIEFQENESLTVEDGEINQQVNLYACKKTTVIIKGKVNAVTLGMLPCLIISVRPVDLLDSGLPKHLCSG